MSPEPLSPGSGPTAPDPARLPKGVHTPLGWTSTLPDQDPAPGSAMPPPQLDGAGPPPSVLQPPPPPRKSPPPVRRASGLDSRRRSSAASSAAPNAARPAVLPAAHARREGSEKLPYSLDRSASEPWIHPDSDLSGRERGRDTPTSMPAARGAGSSHSPCSKDLAEEDRVDEREEGSKRDDASRGQRRASTAVPAREPPRRKGMTQKRTLHLIEQYKLLRAGEFARYPASLPSEFWDRLAEVLNQPEMMDGERERALSGPMVKHRWDYLVRLTRAFSWALDPERWPGTTLKYNRARGGRLEGSEEDWRRLREDKANREKADMVHQAAFAFYEEMRAVGGGQYTLRTFEPADPVVTRTSSEEAESHRPSASSSSRKRLRPLQEPELGSEDDGPFKVRATAAPTLAAPPSVVSTGLAERERMFPIPAAPPPPPSSLPPPVAHGLSPVSSWNHGARSGHPSYPPRQESQSYSLDPGKPYDPRLSTQSSSTAGQTEVNPRETFLHPTSELWDCSSKDELAMSLLHLAQERHNQRARFLELLEQPERSTTESRAARVRLALRSVPPALAPPSAVDHWLSHLFDPSQRDLMRAIALLYDPDDPHTLRLVCGKLSQELGVGRVPTRAYSDAGPSQNQFPHPAPPVARHASTSSLTPLPAVPSSLRHSSLSAPFHRFDPGAVRTSP